MLHLSDLLDYTINNQSSNPDVYLNFDHTYAVSFFKPAESTFNPMPFQLYLAFAACILEG
jgi:hypothetical protein